MSKFLENYSIDLQAYDDVGVNQTLDSLVEEQGELNQISMAIENAFLQLGRANRVEKSIRHAKEFDKNSFKLAMITVEQITLNCGLVYENKTPSLESITDYKSIALEGFGETISKIIEAIKKAFKYIWDSISKFFLWLFSTARRNQNETAIESLEKAVIQAEKSPTRVKPEDMQYYPYLDVLKGLDYGVKVINEKSIEELLERLQKYYSSLSKLIYSFNLGIIGFRDTYQKFVDAADRVAASKLSNSPEKFDFINFQKDFYNSISSTVDVTIQEQYDKANIRKEQNYIAGMREKNGGKADAIEYELNIAENGNSSTMVSDLRISEILGGLSKLYFVLYQGENENYEATTSTQVALSLVEKDSSRYLSPDHLLKVLQNLKEVQHDVYKKQEEIKVQLENARKISSTMLDSLTNINGLKKQVVMEPETADSYERTMNLLFIYLQRQQKFLMRGIYNGSLLGEKSLSNLYKYSLSHDLIYKSI